ncbi:hypothetical protein ACFS5L_16730 [Streptomyces phyllanthi]|uniref:Integral membrane protein n=1 Tax=Streptomyces phyllanthi TaxID=1803180 RepID=A0A5N8W3T0_9ACTN|nr:hypothetical protein [Streptomyces phyllanthi]MPY42157.1 hypothetical protein [Streptomyces phyllanthi]
MRTRVRGWRWRANPLRRRSDVVEAWAALVTTVLLVVGAPLAGVAAGSWAHAAARSEVAAQRAELHRVRGVVVTDAPPAAPAARGDRQPTHHVRARWTESGEDARTGVARVPAGTRRGEFTDVWLDPRGRSVDPPLTGAAVVQHALAVGACTTGGAVAVVLAGRLAVRRVFLRHRLAEWEREWARTGPEWARRWA